MGSWSFCSISSSLSYNGYSACPCLHFFDLGTAFDIFNILRKISMTNLSGIVTVPASTFSSLVKIRKMVVFHPIWPNQSNFFTRDWSENFHSYKELWNRTVLSPDWLQSFFKPLQKDDYQTPFQKKVPLPFPNSCLNPRQLTSSILHTTLWFLWNLLQKWSSPSWWTRPSDSPLYAVNT